MKKPPPERLFVVDLGLARKLDEWIACKPKRVRLWLEIKDYVDEYGLTRETVRGMLAEKGIREGGGKPPLFDVKPRKRARKLFGISEEEYRVERDMISAAKFAIQKHGISSPDFVAAAYRAFEEASNLLTSTTKTIS